MLNALQVIPQVEETANPFTTTIPNLESVTERYSFISTQNFIADVEKFGYKLETMNSPRKGLGMHSMTFSHSALPQADGLNLRLLATNSHDGTSAFRLYVQVLVQVCSNGLVAWQADKNTEAKIVHRGYTIERVSNAIDAVNTRFEGVLNQVKALQSASVSIEQGAAFLRQAAELRDAKPYRLIDLQTVRHSPQAENNAWNVFNRVQESLVKGGYHTVKVLPDGSLAYGNKARELTQVKEKVAVNTKLWALAVETLLNKA